MKLDFSDKIQLFCAASTHMDKTIGAIKHCMDTANFEKVTLLTHLDIDEAGIEAIRIPKITGVEEYSRIIIKDMPGLITSGFALTVQWDGFIVYPESWSDEFYEFDYIGAPWPGWSGPEPICGNGGFCLKSRKFLEAQKVICANVEVFHPEDVVLCQTLRQNFVDMGIRYAPADVAYRFSTEVGDLHKNKSFGFHDFRYNNPFNKEN